MKHKRWSTLLLVGIVGATIIAFVVGILSLNDSTKLMSNAERDHHNHVSNEEIIFDGNHYKLEYPILSDDRSDIYIALPDLVTITDISMYESKNSITLTYLNSKLSYKSGVVQNENAKTDLIMEYKRERDITYLPKEHIEKYLGIKVDYYQDPKMNTISLLSPNEQKKDNIDKEIGTTIFLHKSEVPLAKYEPRNGIYLGGYVIQDEHINADMKQFNQIAGKKHATFFRYVGYGKPFPTEWAKEVIAAGGFPQIAWEPNNGLEEVKDDDYLRGFAKEANSLGVPILLRYASEMNGTWTAYSGDPHLYIKKWKVVHDVMEEEAPNVMMLWNVFTMPENTIDDYYPGDHYVDYVGVNIYNVVYHNDRIEDKSDFEDPLRLLDYVYNKFSHTKPIVIGEYGATNYTVTDGLYHINFAVEKISRMYKYLPELYPRVKFIYYFDVNNLINAPEGRKINNYAITENTRVKNAYAKHINGSSYLSAVQESQNDSEIFSYRDFFFYYKDKLYVDIQFIQEYLKMDVKHLKNEQYNITYNGSEYTFDGESLQINKAAFFEKRTINGIPLHEVMDKFKIEYKFKDENIHIFQ